MSRRPQLAYRHVVRILRNLGFSLARHRRTSHETWKLFRNNRWWAVTVDFHGGNRPFSQRDIRSMIQQSGFSEEEFYSALLKKKVLKNK